MTPETASLHPAAARLRQFIIADLCAIGVGVLLCHGMYLWLLPSPWLLGLAAVVSADGVVIASATRFLSNGQYAHAATTICAGTLGTALGITLIAPSTLPIMVLTAQMPVISRVALRHPSAPSGIHGADHQLRPGPRDACPAAGCVKGVRADTGLLPRRHRDRGADGADPLILRHNSAALRSEAEAATSAHNALMAPNACSRTGQTSLGGFALSLRGCGVLRPCRRS